MPSETIRESLINSTIHTVADVGIDHATTKLLATNAGVNEVYIYRIFGGKDELFKETFFHIDRNFVAALAKFSPILHQRGIDIETSFKLHFKEIWHYALSDKEQCSFFIRYYYSRCYTNDTSKARKEIYTKIIKKFNTAFVHGTDTWWLFNHLLDVTFSSAVKVLRGEIPDTQETEEKICNLIYAAIKPDLKQTV